MPMNDLNDLFLDQLKDIYDAEQRTTKALPKLAKEATSEELSSAFEDHLRETKEHVTRLERVFEAIGEAPEKKTCRAMVGLLEEGDQLVKEDAEESVKDAALIAAAQKVEHYEMATYGCLRDWARLLGNEEAAEILQETLDEEGAADKKLTEIAQSLNVEAMEEGEEDEEDEEETVSATRRAGGSSRPATGAKSRAR